MSPWSLAKGGSEHGEQAALFQYLSVAALHGFKAADDEDCYKVRGYLEDAYGSHPGIPELVWVFAIPNGGSRGKTKDEAMRVGAMLKAEGVKAGVSDIFVPIPRHGRCGLFIEMKREDGGTLSDKQREFGSAMQAAGYGFVCCHGWLEAVKIIKQWLGE